MQEKQYKIAFAPLQGYTDFIYRRLHAAHFSGVDTYYTPFLRLPKRNKDVKNVALENNDMRLVVPQIIGGDADEMNYWLSYLQDLGYQRVDLNFGCPFRLIAGKGRGSGRFKELDKFESLLQHLPSNLDISLKLRLGWNSPQQLLNLMPCINAVPLNSIAVHARLGVQDYKGTTDLDSFEQIYANCVPPLYYNGDITTVQDAQQILTRFPDLAGLMIGRGLLADPDLARKIVHTFTQEVASMSAVLLSDAAPDSPSTPIQARSQQMAASISDNHPYALYRAFHDQLLKEYSTHLEGGDAQILQKMKSIWDYFLPHVDKRIRKKIIKTKRLSDYPSHASMAFSSSL